MAMKRNDEFINTDWTKVLSKNKRGKEDKTLEFKGAIKTYPAMSGMTIGGTGSTIAVGFSIDKAFIFKDDIDGYIFDADDLAYVDEDGNGAMVNLSKVDTCPECKVIAMVTFSDDYSVVEDVSIEEEVFNQFNFTNPKEVQEDIIKRLKITALYGLKANVKIG